MSRPNPKDYKHESISPTKMLGKTFVISAVHKAEYDGTPQLRLEAMVEGVDDIIDIYVSNTTVQNFILDIATTEYIHDPLEFYKSTEQQRHYEIRWATSEQPF